jgi:putative oxygen-independent coproporphyrinogen III oxidase
LTDASPPSLGVYVHWPYCSRICPYCDFNVLRDRGQPEQEALAKAIVADLEGQRELTGPRDLVSIFFGGGTPSLMDPDWAAQIIDAARRLWMPAADLEISLEANPTDAEALGFKAFADAGVQRLSLGVQSLDDAALAWLGRNHDVAAAHRAADLARTVFPRLSIDLIYARPGQTVDGWRAELAQALAWGAEHISPYQLTIEANTAFGRAARRGRLVPPLEPLAAELFDITQNVLEAAGFDAYEVSNHARGATARARHNLVYWRGLDYVGVGPGAHGRLTLAQGRIATEALAGVKDYIRSVDTTGLGFAALEPQTPIEAAEERLLMGLRIDAGVSFAELAPLGLTLAHARVRDLIQTGYLLDDPVRLRASRAGRLVLDRITRDLITGL